MRANTLDEKVWHDIYDAIRRSGQQSETRLCKVVTVDEQRRVIFVAEYSGEEIPLFGQRFKVTYYDHDTQPDATVIVTKRTAIVEPDMPKVGELVAIVDRLGAGIAPRCIGVLLSPGWTGE